MTGSPFRPRTVVLLATVGATSLLIAIIVAVFVDDVGRKPNAMSNSASVSALGHSVFVELLESAGVPTVVSRNETAARAAAESLVVVLEPDVGTESELERLRLVLAHEGPLLVALPKWRGRADVSRPDWVSRVTPAPREEVETLLDELGVRGTLWRPAGQDHSFRGIDGEHSPALESMQMVRGSGARSDWATEEGALLLEVDRGDQGSLWVLCDPDLITNHGIDDGANATLALGLIERLRGGGGAVLVDETVHGFARRESVWKALLEFPLVTVFVHGVLLAALVLFGAMRRFGAPERLPAPFDPGKLVLIDNGARLLAAGDTTIHAASRLFQAAVRRAGAVLHAPDGVDEAATLAWLRDAGSRRGVTRDPVHLKEEMKRLRARGESARPAFVRWAGEVHDWREEVEHGP